MALWLLPFATLRRLVANMAVPAKEAEMGGRPPADRLAWAVAAASAYVPATTCFTKALAVYTLYKRQGYPAALRIGVTKNGGGQLEAHAWVESDGRVVVGGSESASRFRPLIYEDGRGRDSGHILPR